MSRSFCFKSNYTRCITDIRTDMVKLSLLQTRFIDLLPGLHLHEQHDGCHTRISLSLTENLRSLPNLGGVRIAQSLVIYVVFLHYCLSVCLFVVPFLFLQWCQFKFLKDFFKMSGTHSIQVTIEHYK